MCENNCGQPSDEDFGGEFCSLRCLHEWATTQDDLRDNEWPWAV